MQPELILLHCVPFAAVLQCLFATSTSKDELFLSFFEKIHTDAGYKKIKADKKKKSSFQHLRNEAIAAAITDVFCRLPGDALNGRTCTTALKKDVYDRHVASKKFVSKIPSYGASVFWLLPAADVFMIFALFIEKRTATKRTLTSRPRVLRSSISS